jgi:hypothetical protein
MPCQSAMNGFSIVLQRRAESMSNMPNSAEPVIGV